VHVTAEAASETIRLRDDEDVARAQLVERLVEDGAALLFRASLLRVEAELRTSRYTYSRCDSDAGACSG